MIPRERVTELARAHAALEEPTTGAIWIHRERPEAWLVEVDRGGWANIEIRTRTPATWSRGTSVATFAKLLPCRFPRPGP